MGALCDQFIVKLKPEFEEVEFTELMKLIPEKFMIFNR